LAAAPWVTVLRAAVLQLTYDCSPEGKRLRATPS
jgi:hypothetical protein